MSTVYLNGNYLPMEDACVSVMDRGFLFGDGVYEVIPAYGGKLFRLSHHLHRLQNSLDGIRLTNPLSNSAWQEILNEVLERNREQTDAGGDQSVYLQVTRGSAAKRDHGFPDKATPTVFIFSNPIAEPEPVGTTQGIAVITLDDIRWQYCAIKAITLLPNVLLRQQATDNNAAEALLIHNGLVIEGSASNVFVVRDGTILTPPKGEQMLPGITRDLVLELAEQHVLPYSEIDISEDTLRQADEIWITSSTREIAPVTRLDDKPVGNGLPGPVWQSMIELYRHYKNVVRNGTEK
ncbi:MAG: D-amino acid aminotransferase [Gammaproteobacteria bacterium]|nr:MAG: D-amino acid aminotransferase [Gammaproteobacteria bacterium]